MSVMGESPTEPMEWPQQFSTSNKLGPRTFILFRGFSAALLLGQQLAHACAFREEGWLYLIYITRWTMIVATVSECLLLHLALKGMALMQDPSLSRRAAEMPKLVCFALILWHVVHPFSLIDNSLYWASWLLQNQLAELQTLSCLDFYTHAFGQLWLLLSFLWSNVPFSMCAGFAWCLIYSLICIAWTWIHFFAKIGTARPCAAYPQNECPIYAAFDWHKPQFTMVIAVLVCLVACPVACTFHAALASKCRDGCEKSEGEAVADAIVP